jgi:hypothetical protein
MKKATLFVTVLLALASVGLAQRPSPIQKINLTPLSKDVTIDARATKGVRSGIEFFAVQVRADLDDGEIVGVLVDTFSGRENVRMGVISMLNGYGELRLGRGSPFGLPIGSLPIPASQIKTVKLVDADHNLLAEGSF